MTIELTQEEIDIHPDDSFAFLRMALSISLVEKK